MWRKIVEELEGKGLIGPALPIACYRHSDAVKYVSEPGQLPQMAPDGSFHCQTSPMIILTLVSKGDVSKIVNFASVVATSVPSRLV